MMTTIIETYSKIFLGQSLVERFKRLTHKFNQQIEYLFEDIDQREKDRRYRLHFPPTVKPGDVMVFDGDQDPDPFKKHSPPHRIVVIAIIGIWVNYRWENGPEGISHSMMLGPFAYSYIKVDHKE